MNVSQSSASPPTASAVIDEAYDHRLRAAREVKRAGGRVAGFVSTAVPIELISAAGLYPVMITGDCRGSTDLADQWMEALFDPMARAIFQSALSGELEFLDVLIIPRSADSFLRLYLYLREVERLNLCQRLPRIVLFDLLQTQSPTSLRHNRDQLQRLRETLQSITGRPLADEALRSAIADSNRNREALRSLLSRRSALNLSGAFVLKAIATRYLLPVNLHTELLQQILNGPAIAAESVRPRVIVAGNAQDNSACHELLDARGLKVVGDYHWLGDSCCAHDVEVIDDPWLAVAEHYHRHSLTSRRYPHPATELVAHAQHHRAQAVVFYLFEAEEALTWDTPNQVQALAAVGIEALVLNDQPYVVDAATVVEQIDRLTTHLSESKSL
jgi:benzoyl-CoA reductase/2-hydroxyglutaryl-CoA dehydratase subunit BcrC/BadD/HgdB